MENNRTSVEIVFARLWEARFLSHLDLMRGIARAMRRTGLPIYFTEGFNPKPKISYCTQPLSVGHTSQCERVQIQLLGAEEKPIIREDVLNSITSCMLPGLKILEIRIIETGEKKKGHGDYYEYLCFKRNSQKIVTGADVQSVEASNDEANTQSILEKISWKIITLQESLSGIIVTGDEEGADFIADNFSGAALIEIKLGDCWVRPDAAAKAIPEFAGSGDVLYLHRKSEKHLNGHIALHV